MTLIAPRVLLTTIVSCVLVACSGGTSGGDDGPVWGDGSGGGGGVPTPPAGGGTGSPTPYRPGVYLPAESFANKCAAPVPQGSDTESGRAYAAGSVLDENNFLRSWSNDLYLWYRELPDIDPSRESDPRDYFDLLKTNATTPSGNDKDQFHFTYSTPEWIALSQSGVSAGYGAQWVILSSAEDISVVVAYIEPGSPAATAGIQRGDVVLAVDGVTVANVASDSDVDTLNDGLFPTAAGQSHSFTMQQAGNVQMTSADVVSDPVQNVQVVTASTGASVGYLLFNDHIIPAESQLRAAVAQLASQNVSELVLDLRYNGGGYLALASELAYMIGGTTRTAGRTFEQTVFNDKHPSTNPVTGQALQPMPFLDEAVLDTSIQGQSLPTLNLQRVFVLTGPDTCSASEAIINSLRGVGMPVIQIGSTTCGKPYGFYPEDNCATTYFTIQFKGVNDAGFGDYADGFVPTQTPSASDLSQVQGCPVADDFTHQLGNTAEARFAAALNYIANGACPAASGNGVSSMSKSASGIDLSAVDGRAPKSIALTNRILPRS